MQMITCQLMMYGNIFYIFSLKSSDIRDTGTWSVAAVVSVMLALHDIISATEFAKGNRN